MGWVEQNWVQALGWLGSALVVVSLLQARVLRLRLLNLAGCAALVVFNSLVEVWPMVGMNAVLCLINLWFIVPLVRDRHDPSGFTVLSVRPEDAYLRHVLSTHRADIERFRPDLGDPIALVEGARDVRAYLVQRGDETVGLVLLRVHQGRAEVLLDHVTARFRDFSPGEFVWRRSALLDELEVSTVVAPADTVEPYYERVGFSRGAAGEWVLQR